MRCSCAGSGESSRDAAASLFPGRPPGKRKRARPQRRRRPRDSVIWDGGCEGLCGSAVGHAAPRCLGPVPYSERARRWGGGCEVQGGCASGGHTWGEILGREKGTEVLPREPWLDQGSTLALRAGREGFTGSMLARWSSFYGIVHAAAGLPFIQQSTVESLRAQRVCAWGAVPTIVLAA